jgi:hypothetical protein
MRWSLMAVIVAVLLVGADAPRNDVSQLEGRWYGGVWSRCGVVPGFIVNINDPMSILDITDRAVTLRTRKATALPTSNESVDCWTYSIPSNETPKAIDLIPSQGADKGKTQRGIYKIEAIQNYGYCLTLYLARPGADRPSRFLPGPEDGQQLHSFVRYRHGPLR